MFRCAPLGPSDEAGHPLGDKLRGKTLASYLIATGSDGYKLCCRLRKSIPVSIPEKSWSPTLMNGNALDVKTGPFRRVVTEDKRPARSVRNLVSIELKSAE
jgi:hypothetical protein